MGDFELPEDYPENPTREQLQREWASHDAFHRELELLHERIKARNEVLREIARQQELAARRRLWPFF